MKPDNITIRKLTTNDLNHFFSLRLESLQESPSSFLSSYEEEKTRGSDFFEKMLNSDEIHSAIFGAFLEGKILGIAGIYRESAVKAVHKCNIWGVYVKPDYRNHGIGHQLIKAVITHAKDIMKCSIINITVETSNTTAKNLYEKLGFTVWGIEPQAMCVNQKFYDEFHMSLSF